MQNSHNKLLIFLIFLLLLIISALIISNVLVLVLLSNSIEMLQKQNLILMEQLEQHQLVNTNLFQQVSDVYSVIDIEDVIVFCVGVAFVHAIMSYPWF